MTIVFGRILTGSLALAGVCLMPSIAAADDPIVGSWVGNLIQEGQDPFETRLTFVSPRGGVTRYPGQSCGGVLVGDRKASGYEYEETITWGGVDEKDGGCIGGAVHVKVDGDKLQFEWTTNYNGQDYAAAGELHREGGKKR